MNRSAVGTRFNNCIYRHQCFILGPGENKSLDTTSEAQIHASTDEYAMYLKVMVRSKVKDGNLASGKLSVVYVYVGNFDTVSLHEDGELTSDLDSKYKPNLLTAYKPYVLTLKLKSRDLANQNLAVGTPKFAMDFRSCILEQNVLRMVLYATSTLAEAIQDIKKIFEAEFLASPWHDFHSPRMISKTKGQGDFSLHDLMEFDDMKAKPPNPYQPQVTFHTFLQYATIQALGSKFEQDYREKDIVDFEKRTHGLLLVEVKGSPEQVRYMGVLPFPKDSKVRLRTNDTVMLKFIGSLEFPLKNVPAKVIRSSPTLPINAISFAIQWPKKSDGTASGTEGLKVVTHENVSEARTSLRYIVKSHLRSKAVRVRVDLCQRSHELRLNLDALCKISRFGENDTGLLGQWRKLLCAARLDLLERRDIFVDIRKRFPSPEDHMGLNPSQTNAIRNGKNCLGGILNIHGPPGTGKTTIICECAKLYFQTEILSQLVALSPTNLNVDALARRLQNDLVDLQNQGSAAATRYVVRLHSVEAEISVFFEEVNRKRDVGDAQPTMFDNVHVSNMPTSEKVVMRQLVYSRNYREQYIPDNRVQEERLSVGYRMLQLVGCKSGGEAFCKPANHREIYDLYQKCCGINGAKATSTDLERLKELAFELYEVVLCNAAAVIATVSRAALPSMSTSAHIMFIDEASRIDEAAMWSIMALNRDRLKGLVLVGDPFQLRNLVISPTSVNLFAEQKKMTLPERLLEVGFPTHLLNEQMRMVPEIAAPSAFIIYNGRLKNGLGTAVDERPIAKGLIEYNDTRWGMRSSLIYVDVQRGDAVWTERLANGSRTNPYFIRLAFNEIEQLLKRFPTATIAFATPYTEDRQAALDCHAEMVKHADEFPNINNFKVVTWDTSQGLEFDIGFVVLPLIPHTGSIAHEKGRVNVISTRWRCGLYVIGTDSSVERSRPGGGLRVKDWLSEFRKQFWEMSMVAVTDTDSMPVCKWFVTRSQHDEDKSD